MSNVPEFRKQDWTRLFPRKLSAEWSLAHTLAVGVCALSIGCGSSASGGSTDAGSDTDAGSNSDAGSDTDAGSEQMAAITISPKAAQVLTCDKLAFTADVSGLADKTVEWSLSLGRGLGSVDGTGLYSAPLQVPAEPNVSLAKSQVSVIATSHADTSLSASAKVTLATAFPGTLTKIAGSQTNGASGAEFGGVYAHGTVAQGRRVYTVWRTSDDLHTDHLITARSDDGGATWKPSVKALTAVTPNSLNVTPGINCASLAIDAGDPDVLYAVTHLQAASTIDHGKTTGDASVVLAVSTDGGTTFTSYIIKVTNGGPGICPDVASPAKDTVVVSIPDPGDLAGSIDIGIWSDANRGAGFATGTSADALDYDAHGETGALATLAPGHILSIEEGNSTDASGNEWESPRLFTNGKGNLCITYIASYNDTAHPNDLDNVYVQCSKDAGKTFSAKVELDTQGAGDTHVPATAIGAMDDKGHVAVAWTANGTTGPGVGANDYWVSLALSTNSGKSFDKAFRPPTLKGSNPDLGLDGQAYTPSVAYDAQGILWLAYAPYDGDSYGRVAVDKSCDYGKSWSGAVVIDGPLASPTIQVGKPAIVLTDGKAPHLMVYKQDYDTGDPLLYLSLTPSQN